MIEDGGQDGAIPSPDPASVRAALTRIKGSKTFDGQNRIQEFLTYVVEEALAGRQSDIRGKHIAQDVYGRTPSEQGDPENVVRVHARRLRQRLETYYATEGSDDPVRIAISSGGYAPTFHSHHPADNRPNTTLFSRDRVAVFALGAVAGAAICLIAFWPLSARDPAKTSTETSLRQVEARRALMEKSPASLQAVNLAAQAQLLVYPTFDRGRQQLLYEIFQKVIELDPQYYGGYAGAAQSVANLALLSGTEDARERNLDDARRLAEKAMDLAPAEAWTQYASAWVALIDGRKDDAMRLSERARSLAPDDGLALSFHASVSLFTGQFEEAISTATSLDTRFGDHRFPTYNIIGASSFHIGEYRQSVDAFERATGSGGPVSALATAYQAAAYQALGDAGTSQMKIRQLRRAWPNFPVEATLRRIHADDGYADAVRDRLVQAGWR